MEPLEPAIESRSTSKSTVSRRFIARTQRQVDTWRRQPLDDLVLTVLLVDGVHVGDHCLIVALGITEDGNKHALGLWEGSPKHSTICRSLLANLTSRRLRTDRSVLVVLDGAKALRKVVTDTFGLAALLHRGQIHKLRERARSSAGAPALVGKDEAAARL